MEAATQPKLVAQFTAALAWWRDAGVDLDFADAPTRWLVPDGESPAAAALAAAPPAAPTPEPRAPIGGPRDAWPQDLAGFAAWWLAEPALDNGMVKDRVPPHGPAGADLMVVIPHPEQGDANAPEGPALLSGPEGRLLDAMLGAMGIAPDQVYRAAALPRHTPLADWAALAAGGIGDVLAHHIALVAPKRLIVFGNNVLPLLRHNPAQTAKVSWSFNHEGRTIPLLGAYELGVTLGRPSSKAAFWQRWLDWTGTAIA